MIGVDLARRAGVGRLILFHHEPTYSDSRLQEIQATAVAYQAQDPSLPPCEVLLAYEGLHLDLASAALEVQLAPDGETAILTAGSSFDDQVFTRRLAQLAAGGAAILDLAQVERLTTAQLKQLILAGQERSGGPPVLAGPSPTVQEVIRLAGYGDHFAIYPAVADALQAVAAREALNLPRQLIQQRYQIVDRLGPSRLGTVLRVADRHKGSDAALRLLPPALSAETLERFGHHVARLRSLETHGVARTLDFGHTADGAAFLVEELLDGPSLEAQLGALELTAALEAAHRHGVVHGNVTPRDIFLTRDGMKLAGFGLGRLQEGRNLLEAPAVFIAPSHAAPEQILGYPLDARTNLYGLGVTLYQLFTNNVPSRRPVRPCYRHISSRYHAHPARTTRNSHLRWSTCWSSCSRRTPTSSTLKRPRCGVCCRVFRWAQARSSSLGDADWWGVRRRSRRWSRPGRWCWRGAGSWPSSLVNRGSAKPASRSESRPTTRQRWY
jgi:anti-anti-sigma regulatory factor